MRRKIFILPVFLSIMFLHSAIATASIGRIYSLSLNSNDYWIVPDTANILSNPAYINFYPPMLEITAADRDGNPEPFSSLTVKVDERATLGITLGYPHPSFYSGYSTGNPGDVFQDFNSNVDDSVIPEAGEVKTTNGLIHFGYALDNLKLGLSASYIALNAQDVNENAPLGSNEVKTVSHRNLTFNTGLLTGKTGPFESVAANFGAEFPFLTRKYSLTTLTSSDTREINGTQAWVYKLGFAGNILTSHDNYLTISANYEAANFHCASFEHRDNNNDGDFMDMDEEQVDDLFLTQRYSIKYGLADRLLIADRGFVFFGIYSNIYKYKQYASETSAILTENDSSTHKSNRYTIPVIIGGEMNLTDWLTVRLSGTKNIVCFTKLYDESGPEIFTDYTSAESRAIINAGIGLMFRNFSADLLFDSPWSGSSDPLARDYNDYLTTKLSLTWRY